MSPVTQPSGTDISVKSFVQSNVVGPSPKQLGRLQEELAKHQTFPSYYHRKKISDQLSKEFDIPVKLIKTWLKIPSNLSNCQPVAPEQSQGPPARVRGKREVETTICLFALHVF